MNECNCNTPLANVVSKNIQQHELEAGISCSVHTHKTFIILYYCHEAKQYIHLKINLINRIIENVRIRLILLTILLKVFQQT